MNDFNPPITPDKIVKEGWRFSIPIYQRLFVWESEQIDRMLEDLWKASISPSASEPSKPYYIGVITTVEQDDKKGRVFSVVDGQQRLTFLLLFFCDCLTRGERVAEKFVFVNTTDKDDEELDLRIKFLGRNSDEDDIRHYACGKCDEVGNYNYRQFHERMNVFIEKHKGEWEKRKDAFVQYVYSMTSFLANELNGYSNADLNLYFEKMNSTGRQLSPLDQLKGLFATYASEWNDCFNFEKTRKGAETAREGNLAAGDDKSISVQQYLQKEVVDIDKIVCWEGNVSEEPSTNLESASFARLPMRPEILALHALQLTLENNNDWKTKVLKMNEAWRRKSNGGGEDEIQIEYSPRYLLDSFNKVFNATGDSSADFAKTYMGNLQAYRDWIDENIFYLRGELETDGDEGNDSSGLKYAFRELPSQQDQKMLQLQSMLYVSSGEAQKWILDAYNDLNDKSDTEEKLFDYLKRWALTRLPKDPNTFTYNPGMNRVAFWVLDYLLWESMWDVRSLKGKDVDVLFPNGVTLKLSGDQIDAVKRYRFTQNRSVEHLHPQNPPNESEEWKNDRNRNKDAVRNCFGNLCMISQSTNSRLSNEPVDVKFAKIRYALQGHDLQSIKLLLMFAACSGMDSEWTLEKAIEHGKNMLRILGYNDDSINGWKQKLQSSNVMEP
ncbi:DUF262 domain-containing protein [Fibrobacter sp.]|uniref:DUF262 domain-containing protein n=1 Tax=Fibrobacter sp. TaxID=35828 RepID=UPI003890461D